MLTLALLYIPRVIKLGNAQKGFVFYRWIWWDPFLKTSLYHEVVYVLHSEAFAIQSFDKSNGSFFYAMIIRWRCLWAQLPRHPTIMVIIFLLHFLPRRTCCCITTFFPPSFYSFIIVIIGYIQYYGLILRLWQFWSFTHTSWKMLWLLLIPLCFLYLLFHFTSLG
jgi:hypothetical protein